MRASLIGLLLGGVLFGGNSGLAFSAKPRELASSAESAAASVWVLRPDGSQSCGEKEGQAIEDARPELERAGVAVLDQWHGSDGLMHILVCGAPSGQVNAFQIRAGDLSKAQAAPLGFREASPEQLKRITKAGAKK